MRGTCICENSEDHHGEEKRMRMRTAGARSDWKSVELQNLAKATENAMQESRTKPTGMMLWMSRAGSALGRTVYL